jgi:hypothetical protein
MKLLIIAILVIAGATACNPSEKVSITGRPDPNTSTSGTLGSMKASNGALPPSKDYSDPKLRDTLLAKH